MDRSDELVIEGSGIADCDEFGYVAGDKATIEGVQKITDTIVKLSDVPLKDFKNFSYTDYSLEAPF